MIFDWLLQQVHFIVKICDWFARHAQDESIRCEPYLIVGWIVINWDKLTKTMGFFMIFSAMLVELSAIANSLEGRDFRNMKD